MVDCRVLTLSLGLGLAKLGAEESLGRPRDSCGQHLWLSPGFLPFPLSKAMLFLCKVPLPPAYAFGETGLYDQHIFIPGAWSVASRSGFREW